MIVTVNANNAHVLHAIRAAHLLASKDAIDVARRFGTPVLVVEGGQTLSLPPDEASSDASMRLERCASVPTPCNRFPLSELTVVGQAAPGTIAAWSGGHNTGLLVSQRSARFFRGHVRFRDVPHLLIRATPIRRQAQPDLRHFASRHRVIASSRHRVLRDPRPHHNLGAIVPWWSKTTLTPRAPSACRGRGRRPSSMTPRTRSSTPVSESHSPSPTGRHSSGTRPSW
jgi:hypothetical protein